MTSTGIGPIAILGAGSMGGAILQGLVASGVSDISVTNRSAAKAAALADLPGVRSIALVEEPDGNRVAVVGAHIVVLGVKPAQVAALVSEIAADLAPGAVLVSLAAGTTLATLAAAAGPASRAILRAMPNTPAVVGKAVTGIAANELASADDIAAVTALFRTVGTVIETDEPGIDALSTISGSGPAYVFLLIEEFTKAAVRKGFSAADARVMAEQTFIGATALLAHTGEDPAELRRQVTSPGGTTERAIAVLQQADLAALFGAATDAALARAHELAAGD